MRSLRALGGMAPLPARGLVLGARAAAPRGRAGARRWGGRLLLVELGTEAGAVRAADVDHVAAALAGLVGVQADPVVAPQVRAGRARLRCSNHG
ncbi:hypothetical protein STTU_p0055 (plasmid) [Streptomyces sp. Tu6071]|nr:hypothetical protein STTU_p0055 [Streptomyces sp. Tu6071]